MIRHELIMTYDCSTDEIGFGIVPIDTYILRFFYNEINVTATLKDL